MKCAIVVGGLLAAVAAQDPSVIAQLSSLEAELVSKLSPPQSIIPDLLEYVPSSIIADFGNPTILPLVASSVAMNRPAWFSSLPPAALSWVDFAESAYDNIQPQIASLEALATSTLGPGTNTAWTTSLMTATYTGLANSTSSTTATTTTKATGSSSTASLGPSKASSSASSGGAVNGVVVGVIGAAGILGLALAL